MVARRYSDSSPAVTSARVLELLDRFYDLEVDDAGWLRGIVVAVLPLVDRGAGANVNVLRRGPSGATLAGSDSLGHDVRSMWSRFQRAVPPETRWEVELTGPLTNAAHASKRVRRYARDGHAAMGVHSYTSINVDPTSQVRVSIGVPNPEGDREFWPQRDRAVWEGIATHLGAAYRLRSRREQQETPAMVVDQAGRLLHAEPYVSEGPARERLFAALTAVGRARRTSMAPEDALSAWRALHNGCWSIVESIERDGRRLLLARPDAPIDRVAVRQSAAAGVTSPALLSAAEQRVMRGLAQGHSNKRIAGDLGISLSTVSTLLTRARRKLGCRSRVALAVAACSLRHTECE